MSTPLTAGDDDDDDEDATCFRLARRECESIMLLDAFVSLRVALLCGTMCKMFAQNKDVKVKVGLIRSSFVAGQFCFFVF